MLLAHPRKLRSLLLAILPLCLPACGEAPVLLVEDLGFVATDLRGLGDAQVEMLALITSVGLAYSSGDLLALGGSHLEKVRRQARMDRLEAERALEWAGAHEEALRIQYEFAPEWELDVRHLVRLSPRGLPAAERAQARQVTEEALARVRRGEPFPEVAGELSEEPGALERGGLLQPGREGSWVPEFWNAARRLEPGEVSEVVETTYGFHVLYLESRRMIPFAEGRDALVLHLAQGLRDTNRFRGWVEERVGDNPDPVAMNRLLDEEAIALPIGIARALEEEWERTLATVAISLGFQPRMTHAETKATALRALGATDQGSRIARETLRTLAADLLPEIQVADLRDRT